MNIGDMLLASLKEAGAKAVFGIPGDYALPFFEIIEESGALPLYTFSHEPAAGHAADAAARYGGGIGVAAVTYGAGALSMINAVACAFAERSPLVVISGAPAVADIDQGLMLHHQIRRSGSQMRIFEELTCARTVLDDPASAPREVARVLKACKRHSRPVYIELPKDMAKAPCAPPRALPPEAPAEEDAISCAQEIARLLLNAQRPAILADVEVRRFGLEDAVFALASHAGIPLATTFMGTGMFAGKGAPFVGTYLGAAGNGVAGEVIEDADCLLLLGVIACDTNLGMARKKIDLSRAVRINDGSVTAGGKTRHVRMGELVKALHGFLPPRACPVFLPEPSAPAPGDGDGDRPLHADDIAPVLRRSLAESGPMPVAVDVGDCLFVSMGIGSAPLLASGYYATMGFGVPAGLGVQAATGARAFILTGDGGFQMTGWELLNCARMGLDPVVLVLNNRSWGMLGEIQQHPSAYTARNDIRHADLAQVLGGDGYRATTPRELSAALKEAFARRGRFQLVEAMLPAGEVSATLKNYIAAMKTGFPLQIAA